MKIAERIRNIFRRKVVTEIKEDIPEIEQDNTELLFRTKAQFSDGMTMDLQTSTPLSITYGEDGSMTISASDPTKEGSDGKLR